MQRPIFFIQYDSRSGSTFLARNLCQHAYIAIPPETNFVAELFYSGIKRIDSEESRNTALSTILNEPKFEDLDISRDELLALFPTENFHVAKLIQNIYNFWCIKHDPSAILIGIKKDYSQIYSALREWFPESKSLWLIRDGRAVLSSKRRSTMSSTGKPFVSSVFQSVKEWVKTNSALDQASSHLPIKSIFYEQLVDNVDVTIRGIISFLNVEYLFEPREDAYYLVPSRYGSELHKNIYSTPILSARHQWVSSLSKIDIILYEFLAGEELLKYGYTLHKRLPGFYYRIGAWVRSIF